MDATVNNMRKFEDRRDVYAFSPTTGEEYSATPGDYFWLADDQPLVDSEESPMILVTRQEVIAPL